MNKKIINKSKIYGELHTSFGSFELLAPEPEKYNIPWYLREGALSFYVLVKGTARHIIVKGDFGVVPYEHIREEFVNFEVVNDAENIKVDSLE